VKNTNNEAPHYAFFSGLLAEYIFLSTLFSDTLSLYSSLNVSNPAHLTLKGVQFVLKDGTEVDSNVHCICKTCLLWTQVQWTCLKCTFR